MTNIVAFVNALGGLHDCTVTSIRWEPVDHRLTMDVEDIYWNFEGLPEYPGAQEGAFVFSGVIEVRMDISPSESAHFIDKFKINGDAAKGYTATILFWNGQRVDVRSADISCNQTLASTISASA